LKLEFFITWLGLSKIGVQAALLNFNLKHKALLHSIQISEAKSIIFHKNLEQNLLDVHEDVSFLFFFFHFHFFLFFQVNLKAHQHPQVSSVSFLCFDSDSSLGKNLIESLKEISPDCIPSEQTAQRNGVQTKDPLFYVYTVPSFLFGKLLKTSKQASKQANKQ